MQETGGNWLLYDGDCPFCSAYVSYVRLRETVGPVPLLDARAHPERVAEVKARGLDVDTGMVLKLDGRFYHGADCINALALLTCDPAEVVAREHGNVHRSGEFGGAATKTLCPR